MTRLCLLVTGILNLIGSSCKTPTSPFCYSLHEVSLDILLLLHGFLLPTLLLLTSETLRNAVKELLWCSPSTQDISQNLASSLEVAVSSPPMELQKLPDHARPGPDSQTPGLTDQADLVPGKHRRTQYVSNIRKHR